MLPTASVIIVLVLSYLIGSIPFSYLVARIMTGKDIREMGSGNVGATNVMRTTGRLPGVIAMLLDVAKGVCCVILGRHFGGEAWGAATGFMAVIGHSYPVFLGFRGGKSVATGGGAFLVLSPFGILSSVGVFILMLVTFRIVSLASIVASGSFPLFAWIYGSTTGVILCGAVSAALIIYRHKPNLVRLFQGTERRIGESKND